VFSVAFLATAVAAFFVFQKKTAAPG